MIKRTGRRYFLLLVLLAIVLTAAPARAHSNLTASSPLNGSWVAGPVDQVELTFSSPIRFDVSFFEVIDGDGALRRVGDMNVSADQQSVTIQLDPPVTEGLVGVGFTVIAGDSHPKIGSITFGVGAASEGAQRPNLSRLLDPPRAYGLMIHAERALRAGGYVATLLLVGALFYRGWIARRPMPPVMLALAALAGIGLVVAGLGVAATQAGIQARGDTSALLDMGAWKTALDGSATAGLVLRVGAGVGALAFLLRGVAASTWARTAAAIMAASVVAVPFLGHGVSRGPAWLVFSANVGHVLAVAIWSGGLLSLGIDVWRSQRPRPPPDPTMPPSTGIPR